MPGRGEDMTIRDILEVWLKEQELKGGHIER